MIKGHGIAETLRHKSEVFVVRREIGTVSEMG
jgi:hypothetical protein